jgi:hypothetical protein
MTDEWRIGRGTAQFKTALKAVPTRQRFDFTKQYRLGET